MMADASQLSEDEHPRSKHPFTILKLLFAFALIAFLFSTGRLNFRVLLGAYYNVTYLLFGALCCLLAIVATIIRWWVLVHIQKLALGAFDALRLTMIGYFFNIFIPGGTGGDVVRAAYVVRDCPERRSQALTTAFVDRGLGLHALLLLGVSMMAIKPALLSDYPVFKPWLILLAGLLIIGTAFSLLLISERTNGPLIRLCGRFIGGPEAWNDAMKCYREQLRKLFIAYILSLASVIFSVLLIHYMMLAVGSNPTLCF